MLRAAAWALRQRRYRALAALMLALALLCIAAGTWQVSRYTQKVQDNDALRANAHTAAARLSPRLLPLAGTQRAPDADAIRYRSVTVTGNYLPGRQQFLRNQSIDGVNGFLVITPLRTADGVILVARGFLAQTDDARPPASVAGPPDGTVTVTGRLQTPDTADDHAGALPAAMIDTVNVSQQARRLGQPVYDGYLDLDPGQPGGTGLQPFPPPDLSNPAGGAAEWQHLAYVAQWFIFAALALAAPFAVCVHEERDARRRYLGVEDGSREIGEEPVGLGPGPSAPGVVALRTGGGLASRDEPDAARWQQAARLADRYGRSLGRAAPQPQPAPPPPVRPVRSPAPGHDYEPVSSTTAAPVRSADAYHGAYNDYLWQLALADGNIPDVPLPEPKRVSDTAPADGDA